VRLIFGDHSRPVEKIGTGFLRNLITIQQKYPVCVTNEQYEQNGLVVNRT